MEKLNEKIIANAKVAYFFLSIFFLFNLENKDINNPFVKNHAKTAFLLHIGILITYIVFIIYWLGQSIRLLDYSLNHIIAMIIFILLFLTMLYWIYKAHNSKTFKIWEIIKVWEIIWLTKKWNLIDINQDMETDEKDKITIILSYIPFIWYIVSSYYPKNDVIKNISKLNLVVTLIIVLFYIFWNENIANLFSLFYIIFVVFSSLYLVIKNEFLRINLNFIPWLEESFESLNSIIKYLKIYFKKKRFVKLKSLIAEDKIKNREEADRLEKELKTKKDIKLPKFLIYIPIINFIFIFFIKSKYKIHIINWIIISLLIMLTGIAWWLNLVYSRINILFMFPIFYWTWYLQTRLAYKMPFIFWIYEIIKKIFDACRAGIKKIHDISKKEKKFEWKIK